MGAETVNDKTNTWRYRLSGAATQFRGWTFLTLLGKAGFRPDQPRVPAGHADGGQWTDEFDNSPFPLIVASHDTPPQVPENPPPTIRERNRISVAVARYLAMLEIVVLTNHDVAEWVWVHARDRIIAYLEPAKTLDELVSAVGNGRLGFDNHHVVMKTPARQDGFSDDLIEGRDNIVRIPTYKHWEITAWFARKNPRYGNVSPSDFLRGQGWAARRAVGLEALRLHGVLKP